MRDVRQIVALKTLYDEVLSAFEQALDEAEDLTSPEPIPALGKTWLENATSSLISWGTDTRTDAGSLSAVEGTPLGNKVRNTLCELQEQLGKIARGYSFSESPSSIVPELSSTECEDILAADHESIAIASSLIGVLQDIVRPIRMIHASKGEGGPYRDLKRQIDNIYADHIERKNRIELHDQESPADIAVYEDDTESSCQPSKQAHTSFELPVTSQQVESQLPTGVTFHDSGKTDGRKFNTSNVTRPVQINCRYQSGHSDMALIRVAVELRTCNDHFKPIPWLGFDHDANPPMKLREYPIRRGWTAHEIEELKLEKVVNHTAEEALAMIQSWMSFGLLESVLGVKLHTSCFLTRANGSDRPVVHTTCLRQHLESWHRQFVVEKTNVEAIESQAIALRSILDEAQTWNNLLAANTKVEEENVEPFILTQLPAFDPVMRLISLVVEAIWTVVQVLPAQNDRFALNYKWHLTAGNEAALLAQIKANGWCPSLFQGLLELNRAPSSFFEYMSLVKPRGQTEWAHNECVDGNCVAFSIPQDYTTRHTQSCTGCTLLIPSLKEAGQYLESGGIPVIDGANLSMSHSGNKHFRLASSLRNKSGKRDGFVAFSHVWSDGLGSTTEDGLPACQVRWLLNNAREATQSSFFWIDSLCVPRQEDLRRNAIMLMADTYRSAEAVVVLDSRLRCYHSQDPLEERLLGLALSVWQQRLWTLQEGALAKRLFFRYKDKLVDKMEILREAAELKYMPVVRFCLYLLDNITDWVIDSDVSVGALQRNLYLRNTSRSEDETLAIAPLLPSIDISAILQSRGENRMERFWTMLGRVPRSLIIHSGPKLSSVGYRWAPRSLLSQRGSNIIDMKDNQDVITQYGLKARYHCLFVEIPKGCYINKRRFLLDCPWLNCIVDVEQLGPAGAQTLALKTEAMLVFFDEPKAGEAEHPNIGAALGPMEPNSVGDGEGNTCLLFSYKALIRATLYSQSFADRDGADWEECRQKCQGATGRPVETDLVIS